MDTYKLNWTRLQSRIFELLCIKAGISLSQREIAKLIGVSPTAVAAPIASLEKSGIVIRKKQKEMNLLSVKLNRDNKRVMQLKRVENLRQLYESGLADFLENSLPGATIILFGSYSRGEDTIASDIDIAVIGRKEKEIGLEKFDKILERKINLNFYKSLADIHKNLRENLFNGIVLSGGVSL